MGFVGVFTAIYDYQPQADGELEIREGDLLFILEKSADDDWWKAKKKAGAEDEDEPEGLIPNNYVEEATPIQRAKALFDYTRQTDEEVSFTEDADLLVYDVSDPDWTLVGTQSEYGFAPANYIETIGEIEDKPPAPAAPAAPPVAVPQPQHYTEPEEPPTPSSAGSPVQNPATALAGILQKQHEAAVVPPPDINKAVPPTPASPPATLPPRPRVTFTPEASDEDQEGPPPALPRRPPSEIASPPPQPQRYSPPPRQRSPEHEPARPPRPRPQPSPIYASLREEEGGKGVQESPPYNRVAHRDGEGMNSPAGYHLYNVNEMVSVMGKRKKMPTTLGLNLATGTIFISPAKARDGPQQEWTGDKLTHYSIEGKHVFLDLVRPSKNVDLHAGAKDTAEEIVAQIGEIAGGYRAEGLREVIAAGAGGGNKKKGQVLYDFMAQGDDEVTVAVGDEVVILDDSKSEEWWMVRRLKNGREGVVPSSYVEIIGFATAEEGGSNVAGLNVGLSAVEQNRLEESRLAKEAMKKSKEPGESSRSSQRHKRDKSGSKSSHSKPDPSKVRSWTDRSGTFTVEAQFIGLNDGKIHLHKQNGVKIAVPVSKMSVTDLEYVEKATGESLEEDKPLSDIRRRSMRPPEDGKDKAKGRTGASVGPPEYDWFDFFLKAGVGPHQCERYAQNFNRDSMDESVLPDITPEVLRTLGLKEGDVLRVMKHLDARFGRTGGKKGSVSFGDDSVGDANGAGGLFSGPGGALRNNTRRGRPAPNSHASDVVDPNALLSKDEAAKPATPEAKPSSAPAPAEAKPVQRGFEDDAWEVKKAPGAAAPATTTAPAAPASTSPAASQPAVPSLSGAMADLSILHPPLQPTPTAGSQPPSQPALSFEPQQLQQPPKPGANQTFFAQLGQQQTGLPNQQPQQPQQPQVVAPQQTGFGLQPRQRPQAPPTMNQSSLLPPPPARPTSAPQNPQQGFFGQTPLQPQLTGIPNQGMPIAPPGQSLNDLNQQRFSQLQPQPGFMPQGQGMGQYGGGLMSQPTGFMQQPQQQQQQQFGFQSGPFGNSPQGAGPFADPRGQQTGFQPQPTGFQPMQTGSINSVLPPPLQPQPTGMNGFGNNSFTPPPVPPIPQQPTAAPLQPQKTGPAPPVKFGVKPEAKRLAPQPTGLKANLSQATPSNPFGF